LPRAPRSKGPRTCEGVIENERKRGKKKKKVKKKKEKIIEERKER